MFNGWPASYADISAGLTFQRTVSETIEHQLRSSDSICAILLGASGVGKTTAARQAIYRLLRQGFYCWAHKGDHTLLADKWLSVAKYLKRKKQHGTIFIDDAHNHLHQLNELVDLLVSDENGNLKIIAASTRNHWNPRVKTPNIFKFGAVHNLVKLQPEEITRLLQLIDNNAEIRPLAEENFSGFSRHERRRLVDRCESDMFVCLKNIFASEKFDDIILRKYASLQEPYQNIYRLVAAMESAGIRVHRQLVIRVLGIPALEIPAVLSHLTDIVHEYTISEREGIYGWKGRHSVIVDIIARYKFAEVEKLIDLFSKVIDCILPTYEIEIRTIRELCNIESGLSKIPDKSVQNTLLRKMMSVAPGERIPRHRLIRNLIEMGEFEKAETEIRLFDKDFGGDGPVFRYKVNLLVARAIRTSGIMEEDRLAILEKAREMAIVGISRYPNNKNMLAAYCDVGIELYRRTGDLTVFDQAISEMKDAEVRIGDPDISKLISRYERRIAGHVANNDDYIVE